MQEQATNAKNQSLKPLVIPVFLPNAGCPHRCIFCNQFAVTGQHILVPSPEALRDRIDLFLSHRTRDRHPVEIAFYGGNFLGLDPKRITQLLAEAGRYVEKGQAHGIRFSTRPDTVNRSAIDLIKAFPVTTIEIGAQSMVDSVLKVAKRGHTAEDTSQAIRRLQTMGYKTGIQLMVGLPGEDRATLVITGHSTVKLGPDFVRIYPTLVLSGSPLAGWYRQDRYSPIDLDEAVWRAKKLYCLFRASGISVIRMGLQASADLQHPTRVLAGPYHPAFGHLVFSALFLEAAQGTITMAGLQGRPVELRVNPSSESKLRGLRNRNIDTLKVSNGLPSLTIVADDQLSEEQVGLNDRIVSVTAI